MTSGPKIDYDALAQNAMRGVVRTVLTEVARTGLPGDHHFYISFDTQAPGVTLSKRLKEKYPDEMTVVLQHRFWDLLVNEERFEVKLTFDGIPERLVVPFASIRVFFDPSVRYGLQFEDPNQGPDDSGETADPTRPMVVSVNADGTRTGARVTRTGERRPRQPRKPKADKATADIAPSTTSSPRVTPSVAPVPAAPAAAETQEAEAKKADSAQIVSLDAFRKK